MLELTEAPPRTIPLGFSSPSPCLLSEDQAHTSSDTANSSDNFRNPRIYVSALWYLLVMYLSIWEECDSCYVDIGPLPTIHSPDGSSGIVIFSS